MSGGTALALLDGDDVALRHALGRRVAVCVRRVLSIDKAPWLCSNETIVGWDHRGRGETKKGMLLM